MVRRVRCGAVCRHQDRVLAIKMCDPASQEVFWSLPGGAIEHGETAEQATIRETHEETGYQIQLTGPSYQNDYVFRWNDVDYECTTTWFLATPVNMQPDTVDDADYLIEAAWLKWPESRRNLTYHPSIPDAIDSLLRV